MSAAGQLLELLERLGIEQRPARHFADAARLGTDRTMPMVLCVTGALIGAERALADARLQQTMNDDVVGLGRPGEDPRYEAAHVGAIEAERDAGAHLRHVGFHEIRVRARRARLDAVQASVDRRCDLSDSERNASRRGVQHFPGVRHALSASRGAQRDGGSVFTESSKAHPPCHGVTNRGSGPDPAAHRLMTKPECDPIRAALRGRRYGVADGAPGETALTDGVCAARCA